MYKTIPFIHSDSLIDKGYIFLKLDYKLKSWMSEINKNIYRFEKNCNSIELISNGIFD